MSDNRVHPVIPHHVPVAMKAGEVRDKLVGDLKAESIEMLNDTIGAENMEELKAQMEMVKKLKNGEVSCKELTTFVANSENGAMMKSKLMSFGMELGLAQHIGAMKDKAEAMKDEAAWMASEGMQELGLEDDEAAMAMGAVTVLSGIFCSTVTDLEKKTKNRPELCNKDWGQHILKNCPYWKRFLSPWTTLSKSKVSLTLAKIIISLCSFWSLAGYYIFFLDSAKLVVPQDRVAEWRFSSAPMWGVFVLFGLGTPQALRMVVNNVGLELCGSMMARLQNHYDPKDDKEAFKMKRGIGDSKSVLKKQWNLMQTRPKWIYLFIVPMTVICFLVAAGVFFLKFTETKHPYWFAHIVMCWIFIFSIIWLVSLCVVLLVITCKLMELNIKAYGELVDAFCLQVDLIREKEVANFRTGVSKTSASSNDAAKKTDESKEDHIVSQKVRAHPMVIAMQQQVKEYEEYIVEMSKMTTQGEISAIANFGYACFAVGYCLLVVFLYITFIEIRATGSMRRAVLGVCITLAIFATLVVVLQPLLTMSQQAQAWIKLNKSFKSEARQRVSEVLSPQNDPFFLFKKYEGMQDVFSWKILGVTMTFGNIASIFSTYAAIVFSSIILPAIQDYADALKAKVALELVGLKNQTLSPLNATATSALR